MTLLTVSLLGVLGIATALILAVLLLLIVGAVLLVGLARLERLSAWLERRGRGLEALRIPIQVEVLLSLSSKVLILHRRIILPRVQSGHGGRFGIKTFSDQEMRGSRAGRRPLDGESARLQSWQDTQTKENLSFPTSSRPARALLGKIERG